MRTPVQKRDMRIIDSHGRTWQISTLPSSYFAVLMYPVGREPEAEDVFSFYIPKDKVGLEELETRLDKLPTPKSLQP